MKKLLAMLLTLAMLIGCLAGCGEQTVETEAPTKAPETQAPAQQGGNDATEAPAEEKEWFGTEDGKTITLRLWAGVQPQYGYDELVANFNEEYKDKGVQVEYVRYVNNTEGNLQLETYLMGKGEVDIFMTYGGRAQLDKRVESNLIWDMSDALKEYGFDPVTELGEANMAEYIYEDGSCYGFPTKYENVKWMLINVDMFEDAGVPIPYDGWTYSEFLSAIEKLTKGEGQEKVYGVSWNLNASIACVKEVMGSPLDEYYVYKNDEGTEVNYDNDVWREGLTMVKTSLDSGWAIPIEDMFSENMSVANTFLEGKCAIATSVSQMRLCMDTATYPHDFVTALVPGPTPDGDEYNNEYRRLHANTTGAGDCICIAQNTDYKEAAFEFCMWYVKGGMSPLAKGGRIPLWSGLDKNAVIELLKANAGDTIDMKSMEKYLSIDTTLGITAVNGYANAEITSVFQEEFHAMCYGRQTVEETIQNMTTRSNELIQNAMKNSN